MARKTFSNESLSRCDRFCQIFVQIGAILAIFRPFEIFCAVWINRPVANLNSFLLKTTCTYAYLIRPRYSKRTENFKRPKNREDSSDLDENLTESIAAMRSIISEIFGAARLQKNCFQNFFHASCLKTCFLSPCGAENFFKWKFESLRSILSNFRPNRSYPRDFSAVWNLQRRSRSVGRLKVWDRHRLLRLMIKVKLSPPLNN